MSIIPFHPLARHSNRSHSVPSLGHEKMADKKTTREPAISPRHPTRIALMITCLCSMFISCSPAVPGGSTTPMVGQWVTSGMQLEIRPNGSVTSVMNGNRSYGNYHPVQGSRKKGTITGIGRSPTNIEVILLSRDTLQIKTIRQVGEQNSQVLYDTVVLSRSTDDIYKPSSQ